MAKKKVKKEVVEGYTPYWKSCVSGIKKEMKGGSCLHAFYLRDHRVAKKEKHLRITIEEI